ncbi:MAG: endonuclease/exonuclease/phosphatase family protein [Pseudomonadota bacterium]
MKLATYNVEWFDALFADDGSLCEDDGWSARWNVTRRAQIAALGRVFQALDADAIMVIEAPDTSRGRDTVRALEQFTARFGLRQRAVLVGFPNDTQQEIALLYDPDVMSVAHAPGASADAPRFDGALSIDLDTDARGDAVRWSKPPLEARVTVAGRVVQVIGVHAKSKAPHGATSAEEATRISIANRRKQLAQCIWLRRRVEALLAAGEDVIVLGDFNDGPGLDDYEKLFGRSGVEIVMGEPASMYDPHAAQALSSRFAGPTTARFWLRQEQRYLQALLDYIMVSPRLRDLEPRWRIWHPLDDPECFEDQALQKALLAASDHFPVTVEFDPLG